MTNSSLPPEFPTPAIGGDLPDPFYEDSAVITAAIRELVRGPNIPGPVDRTPETHLIANVTRRVEALTSSDPVALRQRLALHAELANALVVVYVRRAGAAPSPQAQATYAGIALRAMAVGSRLVALLGASAPAPNGGDTLARVGHGAGRDGDGE